VQTVHDLIPLALPHPMSARDATRWRRRADVLRSARTVVAVSRWSADQVIGLFDVDPARVEVVHNGVEAAFTPGDAPESPPYLLVVSAWGPHKGFAEAVALAGAIAEAGYPHVLRLAGVHGAWAEERLGEVVDASARPDRVEVLGWVDDLPALYRGASALLCTSRAEGFGLPALEALACGTPVVAFDNTALPEVLGDAGVLVADGDVTAMAEAVGRVLDDASLAADLRARGPARAAQFSWDATVAGYHEVLVAAANA
jgi:glycosyltransferase involved in cell wall biosynthesis